MPMRWDIDHTGRFVTIVGEGPLTLKDMEAHFDALSVAGAMGYAKLVDVSRAELIYDDKDVMLMGARLSAYTSTLESGPLAVIGRNDTITAAFMRFVNISPAKRPARLFATEAEARAWLATQENAVMAPPPGGRTTPGPRQ